MIPRLARVLVVVPVHDEEGLLPDCLAHVAVATDHPLLRDVRVDVAVVLDACSDDSAAVARSSGTPVELVERDDRSVGLARRAGVAHLAAACEDPLRTWVSTTDADSRVPPTWLVDQVSAADRGADLVIGSVLPDRADLGERLFHHWLARHTRPAEHVHGANLGVRLSTYEAAGGFAPVATGEDVALVEAVRQAGAHVVTVGAPVITSARTRGRAPDGFAAYLERLAREVGAASPA